MSYDSIEKSVDGNRTRTFFEFVYGEGRGDVLRYVASNEVLITGSLAPVIAINRSWESRAMKHGKISSSGSLDKSNLEVTCDVDNEVVDLLRVAPPSQPVILTIYKGHLGSNEFKRRWSGRVLSVKLDGPEAVFSCEPVSTSTRRVGLRRNYQYGCPHVLYGRACGMSRAANSMDGTVLTVTSTVELIFARAARTQNILPAELVGGVLTLELASGRQVKRSITDAVTVSTGIKIRLLSVMPELAVGLLTSVTRGCAHNWEACKAFGNTGNYGGTPNVPTKNPFAGNSF